MLLIAKRTELRAREFIAQHGEIFAVFDTATQDSGNISYGVRAGNVRLFVKTAGDPHDSRAFLSHGERVALLRNAICLGCSVSDAALPRLHNAVESVEGPLLAYEWVEGEFGIGLLSFWTVGEQLTMSCRGSDGRTYEMLMRKGDPGYKIRKRRVLISEGGSELTVYPLLAGVRHLNGDRIQRYLASELRDRIRSSGAKVRVIDRVSRAEYTVEPRKVTGQLLHDLPEAKTESGEVEIELYLTEAGSEPVGLYRSGTRVLASLTDLQEFQREPWTSGILEGIIDAPFLNVTPGSRLGVLRDQAFVEFRQALRHIESHLVAQLEERRRAEEERASERILQSIRRAFHEAFLRLPPEDYNWFEVNPHRNRAVPGQDTAGNLPFAPAESEPGDRETAESSGDGSAFFEYAGPLYSVLISPRSSVVAVEGTRPLRAVCRDRRRRQVDSELTYEWTISDGAGSLDRNDGEIVIFTAPSQPGLTQIQVTVQQNEIVCVAEGAVTIAESLIQEPKASSAP